MRQIVADANANATEHQCKKNTCHEALPQHLSSSSKVVGTYLMCYLNIETHTDRMTKAAEEPDAGTHQADARTGTRAKTAHHTCIDVLHHNVHQLCHHAGETEQGGKLDLCNPVELAAFSYEREQCVFTLRVFH